MKIATVRSVLENSNEEASTDTSKVEPPMAFFANCAKARNRVSKEIQPLDAFEIIVSTACRLAKPESNTSFVAAFRVESDLEQKFWIGDLLAIMQGQTSRAGHLHSVSISISCFF